MSARVSSELPQVSAMISKILSAKEVDTLLSALSRSLPDDVRISVQDVDQGHWIGDARAEDHPGEGSQSGPEMFQAQASIVLEDDTIGRVVVRGEDPVTVETLARLAASALSHQAGWRAEKRALARETLNRYREINFLYTASQNLGAVSSVAEFAELQLQEICKVLRVPKGLVLLVDQEGGYLAVTNGFPLGETPEPGWMEALLELEDPYQFPGGTPRLKLEQALASLGFAMALCIPMSYEGRTEGVIVLGDRPEAKEFSAGDEKLLTALAEQIALFLRVARLYADLQDRNVELQRTLRELQSAQAELVRAERMSALGTVASRVVHDVRGPLGVIKGYASMLTHPGFTRDQMGEFSERMIKSVDGIVDMLEEILDFARDRTSLLTKEPTEIGPFLERICEDIRAKLGRDDIEIRLDLQQDLPLIPIDRQKFGRVIFNLANNATEAMAIEGGNLVISLRLQHDRLEVEVSDTGPGIPPEIRDNLFEPFVTQGKRHGTGLGLAIVQKIIEGHEGTIKVRDTQGGGATFLIDLPVA